MLVFKNVLGALVTTNASGATENDFAFVKPGATRNVMVRAISLIGRAAGATTIASVVVRIKKWTTTASSTNAVTPAPVEIGYQAAKSTAGISATTVTSGTGGPTVLGTIGCSQGGPGGWVARDDYSGYLLEGNDAKSIDLFNISGVASVPFECDLEIVE